MTSFFVLKKKKLHRHRNFIPLGIRGASSWVVLFFTGVLFIIISFSASSSPIMGAASLQTPLALGVRAGISQASSFVCNVPFSVEETLLFPTQESVELVMVPTISASLFVEYGQESGRYTSKTLTKTLSVGEVGKFSITGLNHGKKYYYRVRCKNETEKRFGARKEHSFYTLRPENQTFSFLYGADSHIYTLWTQATFYNTTSSEQDYLDSFNLTMGHMLKESVDFHIISGDWVTVDCPCPGGIYNGETYAEGASTNQFTSFQRYRQTISPQLYGQVTKDLPFIYVLGNHEGEAGFYPDEMAFNEQARLSLLPNPFQIYGGNSEGSYYAFESGDALFIVIDVMRYTTVAPQEPDDWTLGAEQMAWLNQTLSHSNKKWKFIFAEHLVGGEQAYSILSPYKWYGRGGLRATLDDLPTGVFKGEQDQIQHLMESYISNGGATFFFSGHDHVAINAAEKPTINGVGTRTYMIKGGRVANSGAPWAINPAFKKEMDWDLDGTADYLEAQGTQKPGYFRITVNGKQSVKFDYVQTDKDNPSVDGTDLFTTTIFSEPKISSYAQRI